MKFDELLSLVADEPVFSSSLLLSGKQDVRRVRLQLSRWVKSGLLVQLRRGLYALAPPWRKIEPHPYLIANRLRSGTYVSLQSALAWHSAIPEQVAVVTSVGPGRPAEAKTPLGIFHMQHLAESLRFGFMRVEVAPRQFAFVATPEKALLDLIYLTPGGDCEAFIRELRLQNPAVFQRTTLDELARRSGKPKLMRACEIIVALLDEEKGEPL